MSEVTSSTSTELKSSEGVLQAERYRALRLNDTMAISECIYCLTRVAHLKLLLPTGRLLSRIGLCLDHQTVNLGRTKLAARTNRPWSSTCYQPTSDLLRDAVLASIQSMIWMSELLIDSSLSVNRLRCRNIEIHKVGPSQGKTTFQFHHRRRLSTPFPFIHDDQVKCASRRRHRRNRQTHPRGFG